MVRLVHTCVIWASTASMTRAKCRALVSILLAVLIPKGIAAQQKPPTFQSQTNLVLVPTGVYSPKGDPVYGLTANDFVIEDNGVEQTVMLDETGDSSPVSIVLAVQVGRSASLQFTKEKGVAADDPFYTEAERRDCRSRKLPCSTTIAGLGAMLTALVEETQGETAVVSFDSEPRLFQDFTDDIDKVSQRLRLLTPGDNGAAILDAVGYSLRLLEPRKGRHVLILVSESRDHGSRVQTLPGIVQKLTLKDTVVYSLTFSPSRSQLLHGFAEPVETTKMNLLAPMQMLIEGMQKNVAEGLANLSGGDSLKFKTRRSFESDFAFINTDIPNRYLLSFQPLNPKPGPHTISVRLRDGNDKDRVRARNAYWALGSSN